MPEAQRVPGWVKAPESLYLRGTGSVAWSLPLAGPDEGSILEIFELTSVWAETAHFQLPTPRGHWRGPISDSKGELGPAVKGAWGAIVGRLWIPLAPRNSPVVGRNTLPYWQGFRVRTGQGMGCV